MFPSLTVGTTAVYTVDNALCWRSGLAVDADGSKNAYATGGRGLDFLANAGKPGNWFGLVCDATGYPIEWEPGRYLSPTSLVDKTKPIGDPTRYVDAETVPYLVLPPELRHAGAQLGDVGVLQLGAQLVAVIAADGGPHGHLTEASIAAHQALGMSGDPKHGGISHGVGVVLFPDSALSPAWPRAVEDFQAQAMGLFQRWGGIARLAMVA